MRWKYHSTTLLVDHNGTVILDGTNCGGFVVDRGHLGQDNTTNFSSIACGTMECDLMFSNLQLTGTLAAFLRSSPQLENKDDEALLGRPVSKNFGEILLKIGQGEIGSSCPDMEELPSLLLDLPDKRHERTVKKLSSHCVG